MLASINLNELAPENKTEIICFAITRESIALFCWDSMQNCLSPFSMHFGIHPRLMQKHLTLWNSKMAWSDFHDSLINKFLFEVWPDR